MFKEVPSGVGKKGVTRLSRDVLKEVLEKGAEWAQENGYGPKEDLKRTEENGRMKGAKPDTVSERALARGMPQLGTLGAGNHFLEIQKVDKIYDQKTAEAFGIQKEGQVTVMIHCLPGDAKILTEHGYTLKINDLEKKWKNLNIKCMNIKKHDLENTNIIKFYKLDPHSGMFKIATKTGKELIATGDHPILTPNGLKFMKDIEDGDKVAVLPFEGVAYEEPTDAIIVSEEDIRRLGGSEKTIKNLKKKRLLPLKFNSEHLPTLTKLLGFLTGDGWLGKNRDRITMKFIGPPEDLKAIKADILKIGYKAPGPYKLYAKSEVTYSDGEKRVIKGSSYQIVVTSLGLPLIFYALGAPFGNKSKTSFEVPHWVLNSPQWIKRLYLAGFFGAELNKPSNPKKEPYRFRNPLLSINKLEKIKSNGHKFLMQISRLLEEFDIKTITTILELKGVITKKGEKTTKLRLKISSKKDNLLKLWSKIGFEYCRERIILSSHASQYLNFEQRTLEKESALTGKSVSKISVTNQNFRLNSMPPFSDFVDSFKLNPPTPIMWDTIKSKKEVKDYKGYVYDFTVAHKDHNFIANSFVTGNCGSRGLGHQIASDYIHKMEQKYGYRHLADRELINAPINSDLGKDYYAAMCCAINYAFANRQMIAHWTRDVFKTVMGTSEGMDMVYGVCHNVCKREKHEIDGETRLVSIMRKGATRSFGPGREEVPEIYRSVGQPILLPGSMGTASYILVGTKKAEEVSFGSTAHGAGRVMSRHEALRHWRGEEVKKRLKEQKDIELKSASWKGLAEEAPGAYKNVDEIVRVSHGIGIGNMVARLVPLGVLKG